MVFLSLVPLTANTAEQLPLKAFTSDGCSDFPDGTPAQKDLWLDCCLQHDFAYWLGGTAAERQAADAELQRCVAAVGQAEIAALMLAGVRVGGSPFWPTRYRWGYGWPYWNGLLPRGYRALTEEERAQAHASLSPEQARALLP